MLPLQLPTASIFHKKLEKHGCILSNVATDALVLKHQVISTHNANKIVKVLDQFHTKMLNLY